MRERPESYFWSRMTRKDNGCLEWTGAINGNGYGGLSMRRFGKRPIGAHVAAYMLKVGPVPNGMQVCHKCDNRACCEPSHLFLGTQSENLTDMVAKGRDRHSPRFGIENPNAKLPWDEICEARLLRKCGFAQQWIADLFGVSQSSISSILIGKTRRNS